MNTFTVIMLVIVAAGIYLIVDAMVPGAGNQIASNCYELLNASGQVVETVCH